MWMMSCTGSGRGGFGEIWKNQQLRTRLRTGKFDFRGSLRPDEFVRYGCRTWWGADGKVIIERLCISLPYAETFNSKVIKGFVPELRSRKCFSCFVIPMFYVYMLWTFYVRFTYPYHEYVINGGKENWKNKWRKFRKWRKISERKKRIRFGFFI